MRLKKRFPSLTFFWLTVLMTVALAAAQSHMPREKILAGFGGTSFAGNEPSGGLIAGAAGNFYGVTNAGGIKGRYDFGYGTVYEVSPAANGGWTTKVLYRFQPDGTDGIWPEGGLVMASSGNLYGTTSQGGGQFCTDGYDKLTCGTVFELSPNGSGGWSEKIIYTFTQEDGFGPAQSMIMDSAGNLYGTTEYSFQSLNRVGGTVFELQHNGEDWTHTILHTFGHGEDGAVPSSPLLFDAAGNLYGETYVGGKGNGAGTVFKLASTGNSWTEDILYTFASEGSTAGGYEPNGGLVFDAAGSLYGTTVSGGIKVAGGCGVAFELTPASGGGWKESVLHTFLCNKYNDLFVETGLTFDSAGNLYGTTSDGGTANLGSVFELKPSASGAWTYFVIQSFQGSPGDGSEPDSNLLFDSKGNLYGTTGYGGSGGGGTVFEITP